MARTKGAKNKEALNDRMKAAAQTYCADPKRDIKAALMKHGYTKKTVDRNAYKYLEKMAPYIQALDEQANRRVVIDKAALAREMANLAFFNFKDYFEKDAAGNMAFKPLDHLSRDEAAAIVGITMETVKVNGADVTRYKYRLADKRQSLKDLAQLMGFMDTRMNMFLLNQQNNNFGITPEMLRAMPTEVLEQLEKMWKKAIQSTGTTHEGKAMEVHSGK